MTATGGHRAARSYASWDPFEASYLEGADLGRLCAATPRSEVVREPFGRRPARAIGARQRSMHGHGITAQSLQCEGGVCSFLTKPSLPNAQLSGAPVGVDRLISRDRAGGPSRSSNVRGIQAAH